MPSLFKRGDRYYLAFYDATRTPKRKQVSLRVTGYRAAQAKAARLRADYEMGSYDPWNPSHPSRERLVLGDAVEAFLKTRANLSPQSIQKYESVLGQLVRHTGWKKAVADIETSDVQEFLDSGDRKPVTKKSYSTTLSPFFNWCVDGGHLDQNPVEGIRLPTIQKAPPKALSGEDVRTLIDAVKTYDREARGFDTGAVRWMVHAIRLTVALGFRASELCQLQWQDIDFENETIRIGGRPGFRTKNAKARLLPLTDHVNAIMTEIPEVSDYVVVSSSGARLSATYLSRRFKKFARLAGLSEHVSLHTLRHTTCTNLIASGVSIEVVRQYMGHSSISVTQRYIHISSLTMREQITLAHKAVSYS